MRISNYIYEVLGKVSPMPSKDVDDLRLDADKWFKEHLEKAQEAQEDAEKEPTLLQKVLLCSETWWFRTLLAGLYIPTIVYIQGLLNPQEEELPDIPDERIR